MQRLRIGLAGLGRMGRIHAANLARRCPSAELAAVTDADAAAAAAVGGRARRARGCRTSTRCCPSVDAVAVATPTGTHAELVTAGRPRRPAGVLREAGLARPARPLWTLSPRSPRRACRSRSGFHRRFDPDWAAAAGPDPGRRAGRGHAVPHLAAGHDRRRTRTSWPRPAGSSWTSPSTTSTSPAGWSARSSR